MKANNRWLYCSLTFLAASLLLTSTQATIGVWDDGYMEKEYREKQKNRFQGNVKRNKEVTRMNKGWTDINKFLNKKCDELANIGIRFGYGFEIGKLADKRLPERTEHFIGWDRKGKSNLRDGRESGSSYTKRSRYYQGHYDRETEVFTAWDGDERMNVSPEHVYLVGCPFRKGDRVACYLTNYVYNQSAWEEIKNFGDDESHHNEELTKFMTTGTVLSVGFDSSVIQFDQAEGPWDETDWIDIQEVKNVRIHGMKATVANPEPTFPVQVATPRFRSIKTDEYCDRLLEWSENKFIEGNVYEHTPSLFVAHDTQHIGSSTCCFNSQSGGFSNGTCVACYRKKKDMWLSPGSIRETGYAFSLVHFHDDGETKWLPNEWIFGLS